MGTYLPKHDTWNTYQKDSSNKAQNEILYIKLTVKMLFSVLYTSQKGSKQHSWRYRSNTAEDKMLYLRVQTLLRRIFYNKNLKQTWRTGMVYTTINLFFLKLLKISLKIQKSPTFQILKA
jgi:hypothetical protein